MSGASRHSLKGGDGKRCGPFIGIEVISDRGCDNVLVFSAVPDFFHFLTG
jgi:hypothetical protein